MVSLAGASAAYPGYQHARQADNQIEQGDIANQNAHIEQQGTEALGRAIAAYQQASMPGAQPMGQPPMGGPPPGPQMPAPGQPSQPMQQGGGVAQPPVMQSPGFTPGPTNAAPQMRAPGFQAQGGLPGPQVQPPQPGGQPPAAMASLPGGQGGIAALQGKLDLPTLMGAISKANPGAPPAVIAAAVTKALPLLNTQAQMDWKQALMADRGRRTDIAGERVDIAEGEAGRKTEQGNRRLDQGDTRIEQQGGELASRDRRRQDQTQQGGERIDIAKGREARLAAQGQIRQDQRWQQLDQQAQSLAERIRSSGDRSQISQWRAIVDAQHKRAMEIIKSGNINNTRLSDDDKKALLKEQNTFYEDQIKQMREHSGNSTGRPPVAESGGQPGQAKDTSRVPAGGAIPGSPPAAAAPAQPQRMQFRDKTTGEVKDFEARDGKWVPVPSAGAAPTPPG